MNNVRMCMYGYVGQISKSAIVDKTCLSNYMFAFVTVVTETEEIKRGGAMYVFLA